MMQLRQKVSVSKNADQLHHNLFIEEERLRTSLRSSKGWRKYQKTGEGDDSDSDDAVIKRLVDSADEFDDFFDRTDKYKNYVIASTSSGKEQTDGAQTYGELKALMEQLCQERLHLTD